MKSTSPGLALLGAMAVAIGCSPDNDRVSVSGNVTLDGTAVESGSITFTPIEGTQSPSAGSDLVDGNYEVSRPQGPKPGIYRVEVRSQRKTGKKIPAGSPAPPGTMVDEMVEAIPAAYNRDSKLRAELKAGENRVNFDLKSK